MRKRTGSCNCGQVRFEVSGEPLRVGLCHCLVCRKETGSLGNFFTVWPSDKISVTGETRSWRLTTDNRHFCALCGSSLFARVDGVNDSRRVMNCGFHDVNAGWLRLTAQSSMWAIGPEDQPTAVHIANLRSWLYRARGVG
jgi:hypothetical protein